LIILSLFAGLTHFPQRESLGRFIDQKNKADSYLRGWLHENNKMELSQYARTETFDSLATKPKVILGTDTVPIVPR
jgi:hypothetical protein